jgi:hypothetical protein
VGPPITTSNGRPRAPSKGGGVRVGRCNSILARKSGRFRPEYGYILSRIRVVDELPLSAVRPPEVLVLIRGRLQHIGQAGDIITRPAAIRTSMVITTLARFALRFGATPCRRLPFPKGQSVFSTISSGGTQGGGANARFAWSGPPLKNPSRIRTGSGSYDTEWVCLRTQGERCT